MTQNEHICAICCRPKIAGDVSSSKRVKTVEGYALLNFAVARFSSFRDIKENHFLTAEAAADIDDNVKRKCISVSLNEVTVQRSRNFYWPHLRHLLSQNQNV